MATKLTSMSTEGSHMTNKSIRGCIQKFPDWPPEVLTANGIALCH